MEYKNYDVKKLDKKKVAAALVLLILFVAVIITIFSNFFSNKTVVCIDAGHGGSDVGAVYGNDERFEKDDTLKVAKEVKNILKEQDIKVVMTRSRDKQVSLEDRSKKSNKAKADIFVSIHRNSSEGAGNGVEVWVKNEDNEKDKVLAENILDNLDDAGIQSNRGVKEGTMESTSSSYYVNKYTNATNCLVELGFISNKKDNELLDKNIEKYAKAIADGIMETLSK